ncbi:MAG: hypothetical protein FJ290_07400 [Planctomycetes bacterium]|nr:hypothetical protein [Planctomycetota bacterium]
MICDLCGQDRVRGDTWLLAFPRRGWPPVTFARVCPGCRFKMRGKATYHRALFLLCCLAFVAAIAGAGLGIVYLVQWLIRLSSS